MEIGSYTCWYFNAFDVCYIDIVCVFVNLVSLSCIIAYGFHVELLGSNIYNCRLGAAYLMETLPTRVDGNFLVAI